MKIFLTILAVLLVLVAGMLVFAYGGFAPVAATVPHSDLVEWYLVTVRENAIESQIQDVQVPPLDDPAKLRTGIIHYQEMCVMCHGAPGVEPTEIARGLNPMPPELYHGEEARELTAEAQEEARHEATEAFWVVKNGIRMTGMPAFGPTHGDEEIWALVALVQRLPELSADEYAQMVRNAGLTLDTGGHHHGEGGHGEGDDGEGGHGEPGHHQEDEGTASEDAGGEAGTGSGDDHHHDDGAQGDHHYGEEGSAS